MYYTILYYMQHEMIKFLCHKYINNININFLLNFSTDNLVFNIFTILNSVQNV